jgi:hypothetical protein
VNRDPVPLDRIAPVVLEKNPEEPAQSTGAGGCLRVDPFSRTGAQEHRFSAPSDEVGAYDLVDSVHIEGPGEREHRSVAARRTRKRVTGRVAPHIRFGFHDADLPGDTA